MDYYYHETVTTTTFIRVLQSFFSRPIGPNDHPIPYCKKTSFSRSRATIFLIRNHIQKGRHAVDSFRWKFCLVFFKYFYTCINNRKRTWNNILLLPRPTIRCGVLLPELMFLTIPQLPFWKRGLFCCAYSLFTAIGSFTAFLIIRPRIPVFFLLLPPLHL